MLKKWSILRTATFWIVGLMNTVFIKPADAGSWQNYIGWILLVLAAIDSYFLIKNYLRKV